MPELPEVETTCRGIRPHIEQTQITNVTVRQPKLRWPITPSLKKHLKNQTITGVRRRAKYILIDTSNGTLMVHLGMTGTLSIVSPSIPASFHDHVDIALSSGELLRYRDPRRFGSIHWSKNIECHALITHLGPEPLSTEFTPDTLYLKSRQRKTSVKQFIMDGKIVVGVGNIYANEALFKAGIHPKRQAGKISLKRYEHLVEQIKTTLSEAIEAGGSTLNDFYNSDGKPGYFQFSHLVYDKANKPCPVCKKPITCTKLGQRATYFCTVCQK
ncbi:MAG: bifunctional DNA-formamidopyrimidine glycosylase/DNA-(apurinic or apyrimidinic site) lyase [Methylococcales bacterium]|jgi:formamidopyrimidine-DNA glycosylase|nr:bifunctional DNA-formamidopyrimidine glycosylase/DNA-(apurinic or apyrimidinic site) lyase [Methylococcales bacterium]MBT7443147.1 bifunctional DNA-formamidopyrimidine glycosylase/DNA-(apurinic or apyrimidinic site) lyase [Methylococcales bacterium]